jgi:twinkle protein
MDLYMQGVCTLWGSFEIKSSRLAHTMLRQYAGSDLNGQLDQFSLWADRFERLPLFFLRFFGSTDVNDVLDAMNYAVYVHDVTHIVLDNLQFMLAGQRRGFDRFENQVSLLHALMFIFMNVS